MKQGTLLSNVRSGIVEDDVVEGLKEEERDSPYRGKPLRKRNKELYPYLKLRCAGDLLL